MIINPFEVQLVKQEEQPRDNDVLLEIVEELSKRHAEQVNAVYEGRVPKESLLPEIERIKAEKKSAHVPSRLVLDSLFGYGILEPFLSDSEITDVLVNRFDCIYIKRRGVKIRVPLSFGSERNLYNYCHKVAAMNGKRLNENTAEVVVTDRDRNLRIVITIKPIAASSPFIVIRKPSTGKSLEQLVREGMLSAPQAEYLRQKVRERKTIIIAGKGGSGKTTLLSALLREVPPTERVHLIQETYEIAPQHPDTICTLIRLTENPQLKSYTLFDLTRDSLLMSLDRIVIGEMKDREAFDFFNAIFTGHTGSMATVHSNSAEETIPRLMLLMKRGSDLSPEILQEILYSSLDIIIYLANYRLQQIRTIENEGGKVRYLTPAIPS